MNATPLHITFFRLFLFSHLWYIHHSHLQLTTATYPRFPPTNNIYLLTQFCVSVSQQTKIHRPFPRVIFFFFLPLAFHPAKPKEPPLSMPMNQPALPSHLISEHADMTYPRFLSCLLGAFSRLAAVLFQHTHDIKRNQAVSNMLGKRNSQTRR